MEKYSSWRDPATGIAPFVPPVPASTAATPLAIRAVALPLAYALAGLRTLLVVLLLLLQFVLVEVLLKICLIVPPLYDLLARAVTCVLARLVLLVLGYCWITVEIVSLKRTARAPPALAFAPSRGDVLIANSQSYIEVLYLAFRYNPTFLLPVSSTGSKASASSSAKITSWRRVSLWTMISSSGTLPERSERGETLEAASKAARRAVVIFPECTTSNNRALLRFGDLHESRVAATSTLLKAYILAFKYDLPTPISPSATLCVPSPSFNPLPHIFSLTTSPLPRNLSVRRLHPSESPSISSSPKSTQLEAVAEALAAVGRLRRTALNWEAKDAFLKFRSSKR